jgi:ABC-2 type transport system ATP-binding protein
VAVIDVIDLAMTFRAPVREEGLRAAIVSLFDREYRDIPAVDGISFSLEPGEVVGFIGPNGAGKTTTLKILSGILHPTGGEVRVLGFIPWERKRAFLRQIAMVRGSRPIGGTGELTVLDSLRFQQLVYDVPRTEFERSLADLREMLAIEPLVHRQIRALSLGERMRAGLAMSLVYQPRVLFLDEPTLGLDVSAVGQMREFITAYARHTGATILLTSHYMADVETLCRRIVLIDKGTIRYNGDLAGLSATLSPFKLLTVALDHPLKVDWTRYGEITVSDGSSTSIRVLRERVPAVTAQLLSDLPVVDLAVANPPLETVIDRVYREGVA